MALLIHAQVTVTGKPEALAHFRDEVNRLLFENETEVTEHHRESELMYDLKMTGGIPFPAFVAASAAHPELKVSMEWVNAQAAVKGFATIENGQLKESRTEKLLEEARGRERLTSIAIGDDGALSLALTFLTREPPEYLGYAITGEHDALIRVVKAGEQSAVLYASSGEAPLWEEKWQIDLAQSVCNYSETSEPIEDALYHELRTHAEEFAAEWLWFDSAPPVETAIERERFRLAGYPVHSANVKYEKLRSLMGQSRASEFSTLGEDLRWLKDVVQQCWADAA
jgi:hypothetical protein